MSTRPSVRPGASNVASLPRTRFGVGDLGAPESEPPTSLSRYDQEFLFHLYRGSELLQENAVDEAKAELERALGLQPRDVEGQALLGVVYFRLGLYPRAINIYEKLCRTNPQEVTPKINLALCYLKTGQAEAARELLETVVEQAPTHKRAWGYLGLVYQRFGDFDKAHVAFERAGRPKLAERMQQLSQQGSDEPPASIPEIGSDEGSLPPPSLRPSLMPPSLRPPLPTMAPVAVVEPPPPQLILPQPAPRLAREAELVFPENPRLALHAEGFLMARVDTSLAVRPQWVSSLAYERVPFTTHSLKRRSAGKSLGEQLGGAAPIVSLIGSGRLVLSPRPDTQLFLVTVSQDDHLYLRESHLVCFEPQVEYETGRLDPHGRDTTIVVKLAGSGTVCGFSHGPVHSLPVAVDRPLQVRADRVIGWLGRLLPRVVPPIEAPSGLNTMVGFTGQGSVLLDIG